MTMRTALDVARDINSGTAAPRGRPDGPRDPVTSGRAATYFADTQKEI
jgi:hypothetical protein